MLQQLECEKKAITKGLYKMLLIKIKSKVIEIVYMYK